MIKIPFIIVAILCCLANLAPAQNQDFGTWLGLEISKKVTKRVEIEWEEEVRIMENFSEIGRFTTSLGGACSLSQFLKVGAGYTWIYRHDINDSFWENRHRGYAYVTGKVKWKRLTFALREKYQSTWYDESVKGFDYSPQHYLRSRFEIKYDIKKSELEPYVSYEIHQQLNNPEGNNIDDARYTAGVEIPLSKNIDFDTYLRHDREMNVKKPDYLYLIGVTLKWKL